MPATTASAPGTGGTAPKQVLATIERARKLL